MMKATGRSSARRGQVSPDPTTRPGEGDDSGLSLPSTPKQLAPGLRESSTGAVIRALRLSRGLSQANLVEKLGSAWDCPRLSRLENRAKLLTHRIINVFAIAFDMAPENLALLLLQAHFPSMQTDSIRQLLHEIIITHERQGKRRSS